MTTDPLNDPAPAVSWKSVREMAGWVATAAVAVASLTYADATNSKDDLHRAELQAVADRRQDERLNSIEAKQKAQDAWLLSICLATKCQPPGSGNGQ